MNSLIALSGKPMQIQEAESPLNSLAKVFQLKAMQDQSDLHQQQADQTRRALASDQAVGEAWKGAVQADGSIDQSRLLRDVAAGGYGAKIPAIQKQLIEADTARAKLREEAAKGYKLFQGTLGARFNDPNLTKDAVLGDVQGLVSAGAFDPAVAAKLVSTLPDDPQQLRGHLRQVVTSQLSPDQMLTAFAPKPTEVDDGQRKFLRDTNPNSPTFGQQVGGGAVQKAPTPEAMLTDERTRTEGALGRDVTMRGQDLTDARARETTAAAITKPFEITGEDGKPILVQQDKLGNIRPVPGYGPKQGASKPLTDTQAKALQFGSRMQAAEGIFDTMARAGTETPSRLKQAVEGVPLVGPALGAAANAVVATPNQQSVEQAQRDFVNAVLRRESGAAISQSEFESARRQYFPAVGDSDQVKAQKKANRELATRGILAEVPDSENRVAAVRAGGASRVPAGTPIRVQNAADYANVPRGAQYVAPDGHVRVKQ